MVWQTPTNRVCNLPHSLADSSLSFLYSVKLDAAVLSLDRAVAGELEAQAAALEVADSVLDVRHAFFEVRCVKRIGQRCSKAVMAYTTAALSTKLFWVRTCFYGQSACDKDEGIALRLRRSNRPTIQEFFLEHVC